MKKPVVTVSPLPSLLMVDGDPPALLPNAPALVRGQLARRLWKYQSREYQSPRVGKSTAVPRPCPYPLTRDLYVECLHAGTRVPVLRAGRPGVEPLELRSMTAGDALRLVR
jgi:hypothetical protein